MIDDQSLISRDSAIAKVIMSLVSPLSISLYSVVLDRVPSYLVIGFCEFLLSLKGGGVTDSESSSFHDFSFLPDFCHACASRPGRPGLRALWTPRRIGSRPKTEGQDEDIDWAAWLSERGDPHTASEERMGANGSSYPHSCSPRIGGNAQPQQTFIGMCSVGARQPANSFAGSATRQKIKWSPS